MKEQGEFWMKEFRFWLERERERENDDDYDDWWR